MQVSQFAMFRFFVFAICQVFLNVVIVALVLLWTIQGLAMSYGLSFDWSAIFSHLVLSLTFLALFPNQPIWRYRMKGPDGRFHTIVGREPLPDEVEE